ncbi:MAG: CpaF family protein, partial [Micrococcales bacterium]|nr:CpaF family protein [Micrococcales bacterium]
MSAEPGTSPGTTPSDLPLFAAPAPAATAAGRVRGTFSMTSPAAPEALAASSSVLRARPEPQPFDGDVDWALVATFRQQASDRLSAALGTDHTRAGTTAQRERGRAIIADLLEDETAERITAGTPAWSPAEQAATATAVEDALFGLGRLQPLVDDDRIENIIITGHDRVTLELTDGSLVPGPPVADSDAHLIDFLVFLASRS